MMQLEFSVSIETVLQSADPKTAQTSLHLSAETVRPVFIYSLPMGVSLSTHFPGFQQVLSTAVKQSDNLVQNLVSLLIITIDAILVTINKILATINKDIQF